MHDAGETRGANGKGGWVTPMAAPTAAVARADGMGATAR